jgi:hypothetical protein
MSERDIADRQAQQLISTYRWAANTAGVASRAAGDGATDGISCRLGDASCAAAHAATVSRSASGQRAAVHRSLLRLQRQYGNRYVGQVLRQAGAVGGDRSDMDAVERSIDQARGGGQGMDHGTRARMESAFGADFSGVRIHTDARADGLNQSLSARAFTTGSDVFFRQGEYSPGSSSGRELLAHELTHVLQQSGDGIQRKMTVSEPGEAAEVEAEATARMVIAQEQNAGADATDLQETSSPEGAQKDLADSRPLMSMHADPAPGTRSHMREQNMTGLLSNGGQSAVADGNLSVAQLLRRALGHATRYRGQARSLDHGSRRMHRKCASCGSVYTTSGHCPTCHAHGEPEKLSNSAIGDTRSVDAAETAPGITSVELIPASSILEPARGSGKNASRDKHQSITNEVISIKEAIINKNGVTRKVAISDRPGAWIARAWNWRRTACHAACWTLGGALGALIAAACAIGTTVTIGGLAIPCVYLVVGGAAAAGGLAALCSDACDQVIADNPSAAAEADPTAPAVADASGRALSDDTAEDLAEGS